MVFAYIIKGVAELVTIYLLLQAAFDAFPREKKRYLCVSFLFLLFVIWQESAKYSVRIGVFLHITALLVVTRTYLTNFANQALVAVFTFLIDSSSQGIVFFLIDHLGYFLVQQHDAPQRIRCVILGAAVVEVITALGISKLIRFYRIYPQRIYTGVFLIASFLCVLAVEMIVTLADESYLQTTPVTLVLILLCVGLCIGLFRQQLQVQEKRRRLEFLEKHNADQVAHYAAFYQYDRDIHKMRHDMKNFIISAQSYLQQREYEKLDQYLSQFLGSIQPAEFIDTGNPLLDAVISAKRTDALQIPFDVSIPLLVYTHIDPMDVAMLLATALDNAIEGCEGHGQPYIRIKIVCQGRLLSLLIQNPTNHPVREKNHRLVTYKKNTSQHGYGIPGMQRITDKYHGHLNWALQDGVFSLRILLQDSQHNRR